MITPLVMGAVISLWPKANVRNVNFETLYSGQFTLPTQLIILNYPVILSYRRSTTVSLETYSLYAAAMKRPDFPHCGWLCVIPGNVVTKNSDPSFFHFLFEIQQVTLVVEYASYKCCVHELSLVNVSYPFYDC